MRIVNRRPTATPTAAPIAALIAAIGAASLCAVGVGAVAVAPSPTFAQAAKPTRDDAKAVALKAAALIAEQGLDTAAEAFNAEGEFKHDEIYVNVIDFAGVWKVYPPRPAGVGHSIINLKDPDGRFIIQDILAVAQGEGEGWVEYSWLNPTTRTFEPKVSYVKRVPGQELIAYVGVYK